MGCSHSAEHLPVLPPCSQIRVHQSCSRGKSTSLSLSELRWTPLHPETISVLRRHWLIKVQTQLWYPFELAEGPVKKEKLRQNVQVWTTVAQAGQKLPPPFGPKRRSAQKSDLWDGHPTPWYIQTRPNPINAHGIWYFKVF